MPEKVIETTDSPNSASWITNEIKNAIVNRDKTFPKRIAESTIENKTRYKHIRNEVTKLIRNGKRDNNFQKLGQKPHTKKIYRTLKTRKRKDNATDIPNLDDLNDYFVSKGPLLNVFWQEPLIIVCKSVLFQIH